jgi:capsid protein
MILNEFGSPARFLEAARPSRQRPWQTPATKDFDELVSGSDWATIVGASRRLFSNVGEVRGCIEQKASYSIGNAFLPAYQGPDPEWGAAATDWLLNWYGICSTAGTVYDFQTVLYLLSVAIDRDGDAFVLLTEQGGLPAIQCIPAHRVGQRDDKPRVESGSYKGLRIRKGVIFNRAGRAVAYRVLGDTEAEDKDVSARDLIHLFDPSFVDQSRGLPLFSHAVNLFRDLSLANEREMAAQLILSSLAFVEHNPTGSPDLYDPTVEIDSSGQPSCLAMESGTVKFFRSGDGSKLEEVANNRPSVNYQAFHDRLIRSALVGTGWPLSLLNMAQGNGTADRISLLQGKKAIADRQHLLIPFCRRVVSYALGKAIDSGILPASRRFWDFGFSVNNQLSIDLGRDSNSLREEYKLGLKNLSEILAEQGKQLETHLRERAEEAALCERIRQEVEARTGVTISPEAMRLN